MDCPGWTTASLCAAPRYSRSSRMRKVAFFCYAFPPVGGGGTPRSTKFVKYLPEFGYEPTVITIDPQTHCVDREFQLDDSQGSDLAAGGYEILRIPNPAASGLGARMRRNRFFPLLWAIAYRWVYDGTRSWAMAAARAFVDRGVARAVDAIYVSAGPHSTLEAGAWASRRLGVPWVADLRDLWNVDSLKFYPSRFHYFWESRLEKRLLNSASAIIANTPLSGERLRERLGPTCAARVTVIPNGFDSDDIATRERIPTNRRDTFTIVHAGTLYDPGKSRTRRGRYRPNDLDNDARSVRPIVEALRAIGRTAPATGKRVRVRLLGYVPPASQRLIQDRGLGEQVLCEGYVPRADAMDAIRSADAFVVLQVAYADPDKPVPYVPGKVYEYLSAGAPIFAPVPPGDLRNLLDCTPQAYVCDYRDPEAMAAALGLLIRDADAGTVRAADRGWLDQFNRRNLTERLAAVLDGVVSVGRYRSKRHHGGSSS